MAAETTDLNKAVTLKDAMKEWLPSFVLYFVHGTKQVM